MSINKKQQLLYDGEFSEHKNSLWQNEQSNAKDIKINSVEWEFREITATHKHTES